MHEGAKNKKTRAKGPAKVRSYGNESFFIKKVESSKEVMRKYALPKELTTSKK